MPAELLAENEVSASSGSAARAGIGTNPSLTTATAVATREVKSTTTQNRLGYAPAQEERTMQPPPHLYYTEVYEKSRYLRHFLNA
jgi:hypothetical protein